MAVPTLTPTSVISKIVLPITGNINNVDSSDNPLPFGIYTSQDIQENYGTTTVNNFKQGAIDQVAHTYKKLGGDVLEIELTEYQVYAAYEEAVLEYSYIVNVHQAKNVLSHTLGNTTGSFDNDGKLLSEDGDDLPRVSAKTNIELKFPKIRFEHAYRVADGSATAAGFGGYDTIYSASISMTNQQQDYDLQALVSADASNSANLLFSDTNLGDKNKIKNKKIEVRKVYYKSPHAMWRFFGYYGGLNTVGNLANYGQYADDTTWELIPAWQNKLQAMAFEDAIYTRMSHYSYELKNNKLRIFPSPVANRFKSLWIEFSVQTDAWDEDSDRTIGMDGINNMNTLPFENIPYRNINAIGKQWIRRFALSLAKEMLGQVRSKFSSIPIPGEAVTLNGAALIGEGREEQDNLRKELQTTLDELTYAKLTEIDAAIADSTGKVMQSIPVPVFVG
tara:strand:+ start:52 stop:1395 length:1344 start_codon:yes stop_codon:yes gene_type:complete